MAEQHHTAGMIALVPTGPSRFTVDGGTPAGEVHCTLAYLGDDMSVLTDAHRSALLTEVAALARDERPAVTRIFARSTWNPDGGPSGDKTPCAVYELEHTAQMAGLASSAQARARDVLGALLPDQHQPFRPHITAGFGVDVSLLKASGPVELPVLRLALGDDVADFALGGQDPRASLTGRTDTMGDEYGTTGVVPGSEPDVSVDPDDPTKLSLHWPCLVVEGMATGEGANRRLIPLGSLGARGLPLTVRGQVTADEGHKGAEAFGKITRLVRHPGPTRISKETGRPFPEGTAVWEAWGEGDATSEPGKLALKGYLTGNSVDMAGAHYEDELSADGKHTTTTMRGGKIAATTLVPVPAFADGYVEVNGSPVERQPAVEPLVAAAWTVELIEPEPLTAAANSEPWRPPVAWFADPKLPGITPITVEGRRVFGHIADFTRPHISVNGRERFARPSPTGQRFFHTGAYRAVDNDGTERKVGVGRLTIGDRKGGGHAPLSLGHKDAQRHYDEACTTWAYVAAGDDAYGTWVSGVLADDADDATVTRALAHPPSGDWRVIDGAEELVAALCVNVPGIPIPRQRVDDGRVTAMVAAGWVPPAPDNPIVLAETVAALVVDQLRPMVAAAAPGVEVEPPPVDLGAARDAGLVELALAELVDVGAAVAEFGDDELAAINAVVAGGAYATAAELSGPEVHLAVALAEDGHDPELANWVTKAGGQPAYLKRIEKHLMAKGMSESRAIATAFNVVKRMCATGDLNFPGNQQVNAGSRAEACSAAAWIKSATKG